MVSHSSSSSLAPQIAAGVATASVIIDLNPDPDECLPKHDGGLIVDRSNISQMEAMLVAGAALFAMVVIVCLLLALLVWVFYEIFTMGESDPNQQSMTSYSYFSNDTIWDPV